jgi:hypothetical protein
MKKALAIILALAVLLGLTAISTAPAAAATSATPHVQTLYAGQNMAVGTVSVWNNASTVYVRYQTNPGYELAKTSLIVDTSAVGDPQADKGNAIPGQFARDTIHNPSVNLYEYAIPISSEWRYPRMDLKIVARALVRVPGADGQVLDLEDARTFGTQFAGANRASHFNYARDLSGPEACALVSSGNRDLIIIDVRPSGTPIPGAIRIIYSASDPGAFAAVVGLLWRWDQWRKSRLLDEKPWLREGLQSGRRLQRMAVRRVPEPVEAGMVYRRER